MIDRATVQKIKDTADIVEVVSDYVHLVRRGANYVGLCPFHNEKTPSFSVNKGRNYCYCFSCHKGGSPVNFIMEKEGISYHDALLQLAKKYGIKVEEKVLTDEEREAQSRRESLYLANEWAMQLFEHNLRETPDGRDIGLQYLYGRGVTDEAIRQFHLGYALDRGSALVDEATKKGFNRDILKLLGLVGTSQQGHDYDRFRGRVIFPVLNSSGKVIAFGGRDLKGGPAKYINSPESELYKKSNELYGMYQARSAIVREDRCFLVEGYLDVIGMWQSGLKNVVASSGTALTDGQISLIHRFTKNVTLIYDGDAAGIKASLRGIDMLLSHQLDVKVLLLPDGDDPDSFARKHTPEEFRKYVADNETDIIRFKTKVLMDEAKDDPQLRVEAIRSVVRSLACIPDKVKRDVYIQECSRILQVSEESVGVATAKARAAVVEQLKKQRQLRDLDKDIEEGRIPPVTPTSGQQQRVEAIPVRENVKQENLRQNPLRPLEWKVIQYCVRYGFLNFCEWVNDNGEKEAMNVVEFVKDELSGDDISFSVKEYDELFTYLLQLRETFIIDLEGFREKISAESDALRKEGFEEIAAKNLNIAEIQREEKKLEERITAMEMERITEFAKAYPSRDLLSHENMIFRRLAAEAVREPHQLSSIYTRQGTNETEEDKLFSLLPTAITVWKNGILDGQFNELLRQFKSICGKGLEEEERNLQAQLSEILKMRSQVAKNIGDRIIYPVNPSRTPGRYRIG